MKDWFSRKLWGKVNCAKCNFTSLLIVLFLRYSHSFALSHVPNYKNVIKHIYQKVSGPWLSMTMWVSLEVSRPFFFSVPKDVSSISILKEEVRCYCCNCRDCYCIIRNSFFIRANENQLHQIRLLWLFPEKIAYAEPPATYLFLLDKAFAKGGYNWLVNPNRNHLIFQGLEQHKLAFKTLPGIGLRQMSYSTHFIS